MEAMLNPNASAAGGNNLNTDNDNDDDNNNVAIPARGYEKLICGDDSYDLRDKEQAQDALEETREYRQELRDGELSEYEGKSTEFGQGGRSRLLYDEVRSQMAVDYHDGKHQMTWQQQHEESQRIVAMRAQQARAADINGINK